MSENESSKPLSGQSSPEEMLLQGARSGNLTLIKELTNAEKGCTTLDINCKGKQKSNHGWTPLHLAAYFGHREVAEYLIKNGANVNVVNDAGDTPLHKAAYTAREEMVLLLLSSNADVFIKNAEGKTAKDFADGDIKKLIKAVEKVDLQKREEKFLNAAREGDLATIKECLQGTHSPNINCTDFLGNTALHCAAYRGQKEAAVLLLQNGIDSTIRNTHGQLAIDLSKNEGMRQLLSLQPTRQMKKTALRFEGMLMRKNRFLGWRAVWTVLERGVLSFFSSRADASTGTKRKGYKYLDGCKIEQNENNSAIFTCHFSDGTSQQFSVPFVHYQQIDCQVSEIHKSETAYGKFVYHGINLSQRCFEIKESLFDYLNKQFSEVKFYCLIYLTAQAQQQIFERQAAALSNTWQDIAKKSTSNKLISVLEEPSYLCLFNQLKQAVDSCRKVSLSLSQCLTVLFQQEEVIISQLERLPVPMFSRNNFSVWSVLKQCIGKIKDEDTITKNDGSEENDDKTISESDIFTSFPSSIASVATLTATGTSKWGRERLPVPMFSRNNFSVWSVLKQCIGKELSKITMPIVFNEPLSFLQRISENMEYSHLLQKANESEDPVERLEYVSAFVVSTLACNWERLGKPFNPLLGETYEFFKENINLKMVCEQVSHHPPISAYHAESPHFTMYGSVQPHLKFWGKSVVINPEGTVTVELLRKEEIYTWTGVDCCVHNIIVGKMWLEQYGNTEIICKKSGLSTVLHFKPCNWLGQNAHTVEGYITDKKKNKLRMLYGKWPNYLKSTSIEAYDEFMKINKKFVPPEYSHYISKELNSKICNPSNNQSVQFEDDLKKEKNLRWYLLKKYYNFTLFAMALNELHDSMKSFLPPTDSRLRPDIQLLENGNVEKLDDH
ncbi:oxysterol-binding protein-related protein 1-like [Centruroides sculpturatus]|uniref:oxysterol-binding protein-related protein 1-like n=1 Tax=Centruroides sculpturatus TaxID=218467 RepID=UPI000C6D896D|nr:oxysterol-binding protein-related protein 1-like [Centruroides sculpturatus]